MPITNTTAMQDVESKQQAEQNQVASLTPMRL